MNSVGEIEGEDLISGATETSPVTTSPEYLRKKSFKLHLKNSSLLDAFSGLAEENQNQDDASDGDPQETVAFATVALKGWLNGTEVHWDDEVIFSLEFKVNEKLKCVYDKLARDNLTLFSDTIGFNNANLLLKRKIDKYTTGFHGGHV